MIGGPSCQGVSRAGRKDKSDPRNMLFGEYVRVIKEVRPRFIVLENVEGFMDMQFAGYVGIAGTQYPDGSVTPDILRRELDSIGYHTLEPQILNAADQQIVAALDLKTAPADYEQAIQSFEVSIGLDGVHKFYTTSSAEMDQSFNFDNFEIVNSESLAQTLSLHGRKVQLIFDIDIYVPDYSFQRTTTTTPESEQWLIDESSHLMHHAKLSL